MYSNINNYIRKNSLYDKLCNTSTETLMKIIKENYHSTKNTFPYAPKFGKYGAAAFTEILYLDKMIEREANYTKHEKYGPLCRQLMYCKMWAFFTAEPQFWEEKVRERIVNTVPSIIDNESYEKIFDFFSSTMMQEINEMEYSKEWRIDSDSIALDMEFRGYISTNPDFNKLVTEFLVPRGLIP